ncbi:MAG TPA: hypothetical protein VEH49_00760, partial [Methylomirabilota bacterium]|nr:hypothetical protein [Methylomirabilota bacterium]
EMKRAEGLKFAPADEESANADPAAREVTRPAKRGAANVPPGLPNDQAAIAQLTEGERMIAERKPRDAEAAFKKVLERYPQQPRARYGLGLVAMLDRDAARAQEMFGGLVKGDAAAQDDPLVLAWSHVYLGRLYQNNDQIELARQEYQAALNVPNGPEQARQAAQKGLASAGGNTTTARP